MTPQNEETLLGYQWGDDNSFIGTYAFPNNRDQETVHLPPKTTLIAPPMNLAVGIEAAFDPATQSWVTRDEVLDWMDADSRIALLAKRAQDAAAALAPEVVPEVVPEVAP